MVILCFIFYPDKFKSLAKGIKNAFVGVPKVNDEAKAITIFIEKYGNSKELVITDKISKFNFDQFYVRSG